MIIEINCKLTKLNVGFINMHTYMDLITFVCIFVLDFGFFRKKLDKFFNKTTKTKCMTFKIYIIRIGIEINI